MKNSGTEEHSGNKYHRTLVGFGGIKATTDVYRVLEAFNVFDPGLQHAIKKLLCAGLRGKGDRRQDLKEAIDAISASLQSIEDKELANDKEN